MKKAQVDVAAQGESSTDSTSSAREVNSPTSRRKRVRHTEAEVTRVEITDESSIKTKASQKRVSNKKTSKSKALESIEQTNSEVGVSEVGVDAPVFSENDDFSNGDFSNGGAVQTFNSQDVQSSVAVPFPNETQFNAPESTVYDDVPFDAQPSSDRFFCSDEKFYLDKFNEDVVDDFDDDFDEDFIQLDDMEFNETLDDSYEEGDDSFEYSDDDIDSEESPDYEDFDKYDSDENVFEDADEGYPAP